METGDIKIRIKREGSKTNSKYESDESFLSKSPSSAKRLNLPSLKAPISGVFYQAASPGEKPFVSVGDKVKKGDTLCILEAMKMMNEVKSDRSGTIKEILVEDGNPVEESDVLFVFQGE